MNLRSSAAALPRASFPVLALALCLAATVPAEAAGKKKKKKEVAESYDATLPQPDLLPTPLMPQALLGACDQTGTPAFISAHVANKRLGGIDVSHYQGVINWREVARNRDIHYVYLKATEGAKLVDDTYQRNLREARKAGLKVGCYHFYSPTATPRDQFQNFTSVVKLKNHDLIPIIDIEHRGKGSLAQFQQNLKQFLAMVEKHYGVQPILYTSRDFYNKFLSGTFSHYKYMIARYHTEIPQLCDNASFILWQYSQTSRIPGIRGNVDRSCFMDNHGMSEILFK